MTRKPILILGAYGRGNAGDDVFILSAAALFADRTLYINSANDALLPAEVRGHIKTISTVSPRDLYEKIKLFASVKEVVYWGGDLWVKLYGTKTPRQLLYKMAITNVMLRTCGKRVYYIGCGIGDLSGYSRWLAQLSGRMAKIVAVREQRSAQVLRLPNVRVLPDLAINLPYHQPRLHILPTDRPFSIVVSVLWSVPDPAHNFPLLIERITQLVDSLEPKDFRITLLPMHVSGEAHDDLWASKVLARHIKRHAVEIFTGRDLPSIIKLLAESDLVIGGRLHASILAALNATPAIGISYRPKVRSFFTDNDVAAYAVDVEALSDLPRLFWSMYNEYAHVSQTFYHVSKRNLSKRADYAALVSEL
ncbi:MAG TPA: polysaccharide pyruvyl transferase family protein [Candidatus Saccharimonadia bacterium]|nr:polysaccharide pyruvyl transferase family protein [Candidatus Saccharimonadia bacterium]